MERKRSFLTSGIHHPSSNSDVDDVKVEVKLEPLSEDELSSAHDFSSGDDEFIVTAQTSSSPKSRNGVKTTGQHTILSPFPSKEHKQKQEDSHFCHSDMDVKPKLINGIIVQAISSVSFEAVLSLKPKLNVHEREPIRKQQKRQQTVADKKVLELNVEGIRVTRSRRQPNLPPTNDTGVAAVRAKRKCPKTRGQNVTTGTGCDKIEADNKPSKSTRRKRTTSKVPLSQLTPEEKLAHKQALAEKHRLRQQLKRQQRTPEAKALEAEKARLRRQRKRTASSEQQTAVVLEKQRRRMKAKRLTMTAEDKALETVKTRLRRQRQRAEMSEQQLAELKAKRSSDYLKRREKLLSKSDAEIEAVKADKRWRAYMSRMAKRAAMDSQELERYEEETRQRRKIHYLNQPVEVHKARAEKNKAWRLNLSGDKKKKFAESVKKAMVKYQQKVKQDPAKYQKYKNRISEYQRNRAANETLEQKNHRLFLFKLRQEKANLRKQLEKQSLSNDEIQQRLEILANQMKARQPTPTSILVYKSKQHDTPLAPFPPSAVQSIILPKVVEHVTFSKTLIDQSSFHESPPIMENSHETLVVDSCQSSSQHNEYNCDKSLPNSHSEPLMSPVAHSVTVPFESIATNLLSPAVSPNEKESPSAISVTLEKSDDALNMCPDCGKTYKHKCSLDDHIRRDHERKYECHLCSKKCASGGKLWRHQREMHGIVDAPPPTNCVKCEHCGQEVLRNYDSHVRKRHPHLIEDETYIFHFPFALKYTGVGTGINAIVECPECSKEIRKQGLIKHMRNVHGIGTKKSFPCSVCGREFKENYHLKEHMRQHDKIEEKMSTFKLLKYTLLQTNVMGTMCRLCGEMLKKDKSYVHLEKKHVEIYANLVNEETFILKCDQCQEHKFTDVDKLAEHMTLKHPDSCEICAECGQVALTRQEIDHHVKLEHEEKVHKKRTLKWKERRTEFDCPVCKQLFERQSECQAHVKAAHPNSVWQCEQCQLVFYAESAREVHRTFCRKKVKEEEEKGSKMTLQCELCGQKLSLFSIGRHYRVIHGAEEESWDCEQCKKGFAQRAYWMKHMMFSHGSPLQQVVERLEKVNCKDKSELKLNVQVAKERKVSRNQASSKVKPSSKERKQIKKVKVTNNEKNESLARKSTLLTISRSGKHKIFDDDDQCNTQYD